MPRAPPTTHPQAAPHRQATAGAQVQLAHAHNKAMQVHVKAVDHTSMLVYQQLQAVHARLNVSIRTQHQMRLELEELKQAAGRGGPACTPAPPHHAAAVP